MTIAAIPLVATSCGDDGSGRTTAPTLDLEAPDEPAVLGPERVVDPAGTGPVEDDTEAAPAVTTDTLVPPTPTDPPRAEPPALGDLVLPCGRPGDGADVGIDDERVVIGVGNDRGGLHTRWSGDGVVEAVRALADHCNSLGGIAGRRIVVEEFDAAVIEVEERMTEACTTVFAMVGHAYLRDQQGEAARLGCGLPSFPAWGPGVGDEAIGVASALTARPEPVPVHAEVASFIAAPADGGRVALVGPDTVGGAAIRARRAFSLLAAELPFEVVADIGYGIDNAPDWKSVVSSARRAEAGTVRLDGSCRTSLIPFLRAAADAAWSPTVLAGAEAYDPGCIAEASDLSLGGVVIEMPFLPVSDGDAAPATVALEQIFAEVDVPVTGDALRAASAFWLWATAAEACGVELDRGCVAAQAVAIDSWTAGGLHAPSDPGTSDVEACVVLLGVDDAGALVRRLPVEAGELDCDALE